MLPSFFACVVSSCFPFFVQLFFSLFFSPFSLICFFFVSAISLVCWLAILFFARVLLAAAIALVHCMPSWTNHPAVMLQFCVWYVSFVATALAELCRAPVVVVVVVVTLVKCLESVVTQRCWSPRKTRKTK